MNRRSVLALVVSIALALSLPSGVAFAESARAKKSATIHGEVVHVFDGDSFVMKSGSRKIEVRVFGIDAPEKTQPWSDRARSRARELLVGEDVLVLVERGRDGYGRVVGDVRLDDGRSFAGLMVGEGLAWQYKRYSNDAEIAALEKKARSAHRGLWSEKNPEPPWDFRRRGSGSLRRICTQAR
ncbi:MAG: hypothetical protein FJ144_11025 [Deltaproteobacteria bacterium]|nr:hypothetical protein [Deltaproteobacteria bacterium]